MINFSGCSSLYGDNSNFVDSTNPWFNRGGNYDNGVLAGQFNFNRNTGAANGNIGSRLVLADYNIKVKILRICVISVCIVCC